MPALLDLLASWRRSLIVALSRSRDPSSGWMWDIQARILAFFVARYEEPETRRRAMERDAEIRARIEAREAEPRPPAIPSYDDIPRIRLACDQPPGQRFPVVIEPRPEAVAADAPPRSGRDLRRLIVAIRSTNSRSRRERHWRWV